MAKDGEKGGWKEYIWNPRTREFLGRTASSWGLIFLFYVAFYTFLAGLFVLTMYVMLQTLDDHTPTRQDRLTTPGMVIRPKADETFEIVYSIQKTESWDMYAQALDKFLARKSDPIMRIKPTPILSPSAYNNTYFLQEDKCSGINDRYYGYQEGKPCIIIKMNRVIGMFPGKDGQAPFVTCAAKREDTEKIGELRYFPPNGTFNLMYYPYYGKKAQVNYSQPLVAVKFLNITTNEDVNIECKINSNNIPTGHERDKFAGKVSFKLRINTNN
uniref:Sodium/potassium-transporting ATPase subunit beta n=1 Tax=Takifugu rubripes TaxID=31033 RepID=A0A674PCZ7_TAKRU